MCDQQWQCRKSFYIFSKETTTFFDHLVLVPPVINDNWVDTVSAIARPLITPLHIPPASLIKKRYIIKRSIIINTIKVGMHPPCCIVLRWALQDKFLGSFYFRFQFPLGCCLMLLNELWKTLGLVPPFLSLILSRPLDSYWWNEPDIFWSRHAAIQFSVKLHLVQLRVSSG